MLTGQKDADIIILNKLSDKDLAAVCQVNKKAQTICQDDHFWRDRTVKMYGVEALIIAKSLANDKSPTNYREFYQSRKIKNYMMCRQIPHSSQLVVEDFYGPSDGIFGSVFTRDDKGLTYLLLKIVYTKTSNSAEINHDIDIKNLERSLKVFREEIPDYRRDDFSDSLIFTDKDETMFINIIDVRPGAPELLRIDAKRIPNFVKSVSPNPIDKFRFLNYIHNGFRTKQLPLTILWSELCVHPYVLNYRLN